MFPPGLPGLALLLLRTSVAIALLLDGYAHRQDVPGWLQVGAILISLSLCVGYFTPIIAALALLFHCAIWLGFGVGDASTAIAFALDATALALLGPGAYSIDSYRFGRRLVVLPPQ
jgi:uncharacterized membrane protein YphA (DoxX/SURF4 family)